jgi:hypothetical protein
MLKHVGIYFFKDFVELMSAEAVHLLVYSGIMAIFGYVLMFAWGCIYFPYALFRAIFRYGLMILVVLSVFGLLSGFGGGIGNLQKGNLLGNIWTIGENVKNTMFGQEQGNVYQGRNNGAAGGGMNNFLLNMIKNQGLDMVKNVFGFGAENNNNAGGNNYQNNQQGNTGYQ